jgi:DNA-binding winged helix-turn-helix (wHTH) protein/Tfp pilus assembly protein PilF
MLSWRRAFRAPYAEGHWRERHSRARIPAVSGSPAIYRFGPFEFDQAGCRLYRDSSPIDLPPRLLDLLALLVARPGDLMAKDDLIAQVWPGVFVTDNSLTRAVSELRRSLGDVAEEPQYIQTVARRGYRFVAPVRTVPRRMADSSAGPDTLVGHRIEADARQHLEAFSADALPEAIAALEHQRAANPEDTRVRVGLAHAYFFQHEATRASPLRGRAFLEKARIEAREACRLDPALGDGWAALGIILAAEGESADARAALRKAIALEPDNWRHHFRHAYVSWGEDRLRSVARTLALQPAQPFAYMLAATVFIARGAFDAATETLKGGVKAQDLQHGRPAQFPGVGLHWTLGLVLAAQGRRDEALEECTRELDFATTQTVYTAEFMTNACVLRGCLLLPDSPALAIEAFDDALRRLPSQGRAHLGLALAYRALDRADDAARELDRMNEAIDWVNSTGRMSEAALVRAAHLVAHDRDEEAVAALEQALVAAAPGPFGWSVLVEPFLARVVRSPAFARVRAILAERAS